VNNPGLEEKVKRRTAELTAANGELQSFAYSISHDLRAPLRAIDGFAAMLKEDHGDTLDDEGRWLCEAIERNTRRMGTLIDSLLTYSRIGRAQVQYADVDMDGLAREVCNSLIPDYGKDRVAATVRSLPRVAGDATLLRVVWENLIGNALKYSSKVPTAAVEIWCDEEGAECVYHIRDNGAGFDMEYASKLFGVFQRLHGNEEFEGTGVGLAIVERIVHRHGGRVWAEGEVGTGATFSFSLPRHAPADV
jgi:light-regulated signal transduction histidine kinase (bacteriophytochrome)